MPRRSHSEDSSSSSERNSRRRQRRDHNTSRDSRRKVKYGSSCGIRSVNEYCDWLRSNRFSVHKGHSSHEAKTDNYTGGRLRTDISTEVGPGGAITEFNADATVHSFGIQSVGQINVGRGYVGGGLGFGVGGVKAKLEGGLNVVDANFKFSENQGVDVNIGVKADSGFEAGVDGVSAEVLGFGVSLGRKTGISTPIGELNVKLW